jgi:Tfp pilus assembly protein PilV
MRYRNDRDRGALLLELLIALGVLVVGILAYLSSFASSFRASQVVFAQDEAQIALENVAEMLRNQPIEDVLSNFNGTSMNVGAREGYEGRATTCAIRCYTDMAAMPDEFGPVYVVNGSGGAPAILPVRLSVKFTTSDGVRTHDLYIVLGSTESF